MFEGYIVRQKTYTCRCGKKNNIPSNTFKCGCGRIATTNNGKVQIQDKKK